MELIENTQMGTMPASVLVSRLNEICYTLDKNMRDAKHLIDVTIKTLCDYELYISEYEKRFDARNATKIKEQITNLKTETLCDVLDNLAAVLDYSKDSRNAQKTISENLN